MIKLTNPLNRDGILYEKGAILTLSLNDELELIANGLAEAYPTMKIEQKSDNEINNKVLSEEVGEADQAVAQEEVEENKEDVPKESQTKGVEDPKPKDEKKTSTRIGRTTKK